MKKKTLIVLLIIPFIIGLISFVSVILLNITVASDITGIKWNYGDTAAFKLNVGNGYKLEAEPEINNSSLIIRPGNDLIWEVIDGEDIVEINKDNKGDYYLFTLKEGDNALIACRTENGNVKRQLKVVVYEDGAITIDPVRKNANNPIESTRYFGEFDVDDSSKEEMNGLIKKKASFEVKVQVYGDNITSQNVRVASGTSSNISFSNNIVTINDANITTASLVLESTDNSYIKSTYTFNIVPGGVNVYDYNDLLLTTNYSENGEITVMQTNLGSAREVYQGTDLDLGGDQSAYVWLPNQTLDKKNPNENIELFGNILSFDERGVPIYNFDQELYTMETTYNHEFADAYNLENPNNPLDTTIKVGLRVQKDFYGNGYQINMNNLCFPNHGEIDTEVRKLYPTKGEDYFYGPLSYVSIGNAQLEVIRAFGQDNAGLMLDGDNITLNDLKIQNMDDNSNKRNYSYVGTVIEVNGKNNTIKNAEVKLGKNLIRAFDSDNLTIDNSILRRSAEFNLMLGSNKANKVDTSKQIEINGQTSTLGEFLDINNKTLNSANAYLERFLDLGSFTDGTYGGEVAQCDDETLYNVLEKIQGYLNNTTGYYDSNSNLNYAATVNLNDSNLSESGIFSIAFESMFNGPFLYNGLSATVNNVLSSYLKGSVLPDNIGGTSQPVKLILSGDTNINDWKKISDIDITNLIEERLSVLFNQFDIDVEIGIDQFFPLKAILKDVANSSIYKDSDGNEWLNTMIAYYGGGSNLSTVEDKRSTSIDQGINAEINLLRNFKKYVSTGDSDDWTTLVSNVLAKCVLFAIGFDSFNFVVNSAGEIPSSDSLL